MTWLEFRDRVCADGMAALPTHVVRLRAAPSDVAALQQAGLSRLLDHAVRHSPFHRARLAGVDIRIISASDLTALPVMTKEQMMSSLDDVFTDSRLTRARVEQALAETEETPVPIDGEFLALATGGSTGRRAIITYDVPGLVGYLCSLARPMAARLQEVAGDGPLPTLTLAMVAAASAKHATQAMAHFAAGTLPFRFDHVPATMPLPDIVAQLNTSQPPALMGYASMIYRLAAEQRAGRLQISPLSVSATSESLDTAMRDAITEAFGIPVVNTFGSTEGLVGATPPGGDAIVFNTDLCIVELVDDEYRPVETGVPSSRILLTNLYNLTQPLIRYEITDRFRQVADPNGTGLLNAVVHGRAEEILRYGAVEIHPHAVTTVMVGAAGVVDYQVHQTVGGLRIDLVTEPGFDDDLLADTLRASLGRAGLSDAKVELRRVEALRRDEKTGKVRRFNPLPRTDGLNA